MQLTFQFQILSFVIIIFIFFLLLLDYSVMNPAIVHFADAVREISEKISKEKIVNNMQDLNLTGLTISNPSDYFRDVNLGVSDAAREIVEKSSKGLLVTENKDNSLHEAKLTGLISSKPPDYFRDQEKKGELYHWNQKRERIPKYQMRGDYLHINANFPCLYGENVIGTWNTVLDGHKFACGATEISGAPIIYSFGSNSVQDFELSFLQTRQDSKIFIFEIDKTHEVPLNIRLPNISYNSLGLGYEPNNIGPVKSLKEIMQSFGHSYIDVLKMDIEGLILPLLSVPLNLFISDKYISLHRGRMELCPERT